MTKRIIIVGAGLFGSVIAAWLRLRDHDVTVIADQREGMGSKAAACLMKPSWASNMSKMEYKEAIALLDELYGVKTIPFEVRGGAKVDLQWVDPAKVLLKPDWRLEVNGIEWGNRTHGPIVHIGTPSNPQASLVTSVVILATGYWGDLLPIDRDINIQPKGGWAFLAGGTQPAFLDPWAPYKQIVTFNRAPDQIWIGDGTSLKPESMTEARMEQSRGRCRNALYKRPETDLTPIKGFRPYVPGLREPALVQQVEPGVIVATGGAKNGTLGAAWTARKICGMIEGGVL